MKDVKIFLNDVDKEYIINTLDNINLKTKERYSINFVDLEGNTEEKAAIKLEVSKRTIQNYRKSAYAKIKKYLNKKAKG